METKLYRDLEYFLLHHISENGEKVPVRLTVITAAIRMVTIDSGMETRNGIHIRPKTREESV